MPLIFSSNFPQQVRHDPPTFGYKGVYLQSSLITMKTFFPCPKMSLDFVFSSREGWKKEHPPSSASSSDPLAKTAWRRKHGEMAQIFSSNLASCGDEATALITAATVLQPQQNGLWKSIPPHPTPVDRSVLVRNIWNSVLVRKGPIGKGKEWETGGQVKAEERGRQWTSQKQDGGQRGPKRYEFEAEWERGYKGKNLLKLS